MTEFELKFQVPDERLAAVEAALRRGAVERQRLRARYFDTPLEALARHCLVLRLRQEGRAWVQAAKGPGRDAFHRLEHEVPVASGEEAPDIARHGRHPVGKLLRAALGDAAHELRPVFETDVTRLTRMVETAGTAVEIALDRGRVRAGRRSHPIQEIEFELKQGSPAAAAELAGSWAREHGLWLDPLSKSALGRRLAEGVTEAPPVQARRPEGKVDGPGALLASILGAALEQVLGNARELAVGAGNDEHVHQLRVGLRRLRTALRELHGIAGLQALDPAIEPALRALFQVLGQHRDRATLLPALEQELAGAGAPPLAGWQPPLPDLPAAVREPAFQSALLQLIVLAQELQEAPDDGKLAATRKTVAARLRKLQRQVQRDGKRFEQLEVPRRHRVRKRLKRLRYLAELVRPLFAARAVDRFVRALQALQDALGEYQDASTARALFEAHAQRHPAAWFAVGWLAARERELAADCQHACRQMADDAAPFWT
jgi:inorganic triphosphatase YgiF